MDSLLIQSVAQLSLQLKSLRKARGLTQADFAKRLNITQSRYAQIEKDPGVISTARLLEILALLAVDVVLKPRGGTSARPAKPPRGEDW